MSRYLPSEKISDEYLATERKTLENYVDSINLMSWLVYNKAIGRLVRDVEE